MTIYHDRFKAMGTDVDILIASDETRPPFDAFLTVRLLFEAQEGRFSRFRDTSLLSRLNAGDEVENPWLAEACRMALSAWEFTGGRFNPMVLPALCAAGYDRSFEAIGDGGEPRPGEVPSPIASVRIHGDSVALLGGGIDLGGIVKGWTVDLAVEALRERFAGVLVNAGGDMRCEGAEQGSEGWLVSVASPAGGQPAWQGVLTGALATSSSIGRRWRTRAGVEHHLIDPATGLPATSPFVQATAWAERCWIAECWAKAIVIGGELALRASQKAGVAAITLGA